MFATVPTKSMRSRSSLKILFAYNCLYPYVWQILGKLKEAVIQDNGNKEYDSCGAQYDNYITKYSGNSKDNFSLHYITLPRVC